MSTNLIVNGITYAYPNVGDQLWGTAATNWAVAVTSGMLQKAGGNFTLTADANFGPNYGLLSQYFTSRTTNPASAGNIRLAKTDSIKWRNNANSADLALAISGSDLLTYGGVNVLLADGSIPFSGSITLSTASTAGTQVNVNNTGSGGKNFRLVSTGSGDVDGAGLFKLYNITDGFNLKFQTAASDVVVNRATTDTLTNKTITARYNTGSSGIRLSVKDFGATGDGSTDDTTAISNAIASLSAGGSLYFPPGTYIISSTVTIGLSNVKLFGDPAISIIKVKAGAVNFTPMMAATSQTNLVIDGLTFDANQANRSGQSMTWDGLSLSTCTDCLISQCTFQNTLGYNGSASACGLSFCTRVRISNSSAKNCGLLGTAASDGFYTSGTAILIENCTGYNCSDTAFVLEATNYSGIVGCTAYGDGTGSGVAGLGNVAGIDNFTGSDCVGNFIDGLSGTGWYGTVYGGLTIAVLGASAGNLLNTVISNVTLKNTQATHNAGVVIRHPMGATAATGMCKYTTLTNCTVDMGSDTHGQQALVIQGATNWLTITNCQFISSNSSTTCLQLVSTPTASCTTANTSTNVTTASTASLYPGMLVTGTGIPANTTISSITNSTTFVINNAATASATNTLTFSPAYSYFNFSNNIVTTNNTFGVQWGGANSTNLIFNNNIIDGQSTSAYGLYCSGGASNISTPQNQFVGSFGQQPVGGDATTSPRTIDHAVYASAVPSTSNYGYWLKGQRIINNSGTTGQPNGWVCTSAGVAGTTATFTALANL